MPNDHSLALAATKNRTLREDETGATDVYFSLRTEGETILIDHREMNPHGLALCGRIT
jgi:hypothetical protein